MHLNTAPIPPAQTSADVKNKRHPTIKIPVFTIGDKIAEIETANLICLRESNSKTSPVTKPAKTPLAITVRIVPKTSIARNGLASPEIKTARLKTKPNQAPIFLPPIAAPIAIGNNESVIENTPNLICMLTNCSTNTIAVNTAYITKFLVDREGNVVRRFEPTESLDDVKAAVKELL